VAIFLLDIEGTTTPIAFVTGTLVPYARTRLHGYLERHGASMQPAFRREYDADDEARRTVPPWDAADAQAGVERYAQWLMDHDRKSSALKELQGRIWEDGYRAGELIAPVYPDVAPAFARWRQDGHALGIFSSGSVLAQQWLFRRSTAGDLTPHLTWYFDTGVGRKQDAASYERIARETGEPAGSITFISDVAAELDAARAAGMQTIMTLRPGNHPQPEHSHRMVRSLLEINGPPPLPSSNAR
jgi:enolase-phosphatase E1